jgi:hypothetical protein
MVALSPVMFWATAGVVIVSGPTTAAATAIPNAAITATAIKNSFEFIDDVGEFIATHVYYLEI